MSSAGVLTLYVRAGCHLCADAEALLRRLGCDVTTLDVDGDPDLRRRYGEAVPVLEREGRILLSGKISAGALRRALRMSAGT